MMMNVLSDLLLLFKNKHLLNMNQDIFHFGSSFHLLKKIIIIAFLTLALPYISLDRILVR